MDDEDTSTTKFGSTVPFAEPKWYDSSIKTPYYNDHHREFRAKIRKFVDDEIIPHVEEWELKNSIPQEAYQKAAEVGLLPAVVGWPEDIFGGRPQGYDGFFAFICFDELSRCASGGVVWGLVGGMGIGLPPIAHFASEELKKNVALPCIRGEKRIALAVSEPTAGSDVANLKTVAKDDGDFYIVNGLKKWITCGMFADYFTTAVRTGDEDSGMAGVSLLLIEKDRKGVSVRPMDCMGVKGSGTAYVEFDEVRVPKKNLVGDITILLRNFVTERLGIGIQANRFAREALRLSIEHIRKRKVFGKTLDKQPVVRYKIATMARMVETTHAFLESLCYRIVIEEKEGGNWLEPLLKLGAEAALAKVQATRTFEHCAREAAHLYGGNCYVKGNRVEHLYRQVLSLAIPGGSEDVMVDAAARLSLKGML
mmetsp:Transcript_421/g.702  ORF Transcript_421/g.702 Transcript_421/m.702 type:complete len:423 (-) Transcript_421:192-1460(-)|eukprot:CAMPEP_0197521530 /NCGR_PEP_ID=MMETSP1318-20131121/6799_1 /TAXON_ID=552666 /ORGANISM="Partenskyella glossopodia, Strain RCC365" /LENGTH=422 /DNA_ID=CAMNT_0043073561 /DNA_START=89 /DNA_END=1357 /DNA_ORIENTATION=-